MLLAIDIGNTNISAAVFSANHTALKHFDIAAKNYSRKKLKDKLSNLQITDTVICSVVPDLTRILSKDLLNLTAKKPYIIGKEVIVPLKSNYRPGQLGQDRLVNAYYASLFYRPPLIVIDSGTAITFDIISKDKTYLGGLIIPGMEISLKSLKERTALLPAVRLKTPKGIIGKDTQNSILSGIVYGAVGSCKEITGKIKKIIGKNAIILGTGGDIYLIKKFSQIKLKIDRQLTLKGINLLYNNEIKKRG
jgi:type III pantothenate kinase